MPVQSPFKTLHQETRWAYSTTFPSPHGIHKPQTKRNWPWKWLLCTVNKLRKWASNILVIFRPDGAAFITGFPRDVWHEPSSGVGLITWWHRRRRRGSCRTTRLFLVVITVCLTERRPRLTFNQLLGQRYHFLNTGRPFSSHDQIPPPFTRQFERIFT